jgi:hypothetical protein
MSRSRRKGTGDTDRLAPYFAATQRMLDDHFLREKNEVAPDNEVESKRVRKRTCAQKKARQQELFTETTP